LRTTKRGAIALASFATALALVAAACGSSGKSNSNTESTGTTAGSGATGLSINYSSLSGTLNGSGSTFQQAFDEAAIQGFSDKASNVTVNYAGGGSATGKTQLAGQTVQWAGTDSTIKPDQLSSFKGGTVLYFPTVAAPITVSYNLSSVKSLKLSGSTLGGIFAGTIKTWNNAAIKADNPNTTLPSTAITIVHRGEGSGTTNQFTKYLTLAGGSAWTLGTGDTVNWPADSKSGSGNAGVAQAIKSTDGAIGYVDYADALAAKLVFASIKNKSGSFIAPSLEASTAALSGAQVNPDLTYSALDTTVANGYPITAATYVIVYQKQPDAGIGKALQGWLNYLLTDAQALAANAHYAKLPSNLQQKAIDQLKTLQIG
jgi:phosphate transport system substrate-binding protein